MDMTQKLDVLGTIRDGVEIGRRNIGPIIINVVLWALTCWIPYLNVGTTIGLFVGIVLKASKGEAISSTEIFNPHYRKYLGEFFLTSGFIFIGVLIGIIFGIIPGLVIQLAWSLSLLLLIERGINPTEAITLSNKYTYGYKWRMFAIRFLTGLAFAIVISVLSLIPIMGSLIGFCLSLILIFVNIGISASIYQQLTGVAETSEPLTV